MFILKYIFFFILDKRFTFIIIKNIYYIFNQPLSRYSQMNWTNKFILFQMIHLIFLRGVQ